MHVYVPESYVQSATGKLPKYFVLEWVVVAVEEMGTIVAMVGTYRSIW